MLKYKFSLGGLKKEVSTKNLDSLNANILTPLPPMEEPYDPSESVVNIPIPVDNIFFKIPLTTNFDNSRKSEVVEREFISNELSKAVNPIFDYERVNFIPVDSENNKLEFIRYNVRLLNSNSFPTNTFFGDVGFVNNDIKFRKNNFRRSFLELSFYDSPLTTDQRLFFKITLFNRINEDNFNIDINSLPIFYIRYNPNINPTKQNEGYYLYYFSENVEDTPNELYMRATFNNAKNGKSYNLMTSSTPQNIVNLQSMLHTKYILNRTNNGYFYTLDTTYSNNINYNNNGVDVTLYEVQAQ